MTIGKTASTLRYQSQALSQSITSPGTKQVKRMQYPLSPSNFFLSMAHCRGCNSLTFCHSAISCDTCNPTLIYKYIYAIDPTFPLSYSKVWSNDMCDSAISAITPRYRIGRSRNASFATICDPNPNSASASKIKNLLSHCNLGGYKNGA